MMAARVDAASMFGAWGYVTSLRTLVGSFCLAGCLIMIRESCHSMAARPFVAPRPRFSFA